MRLASVAAADPDGVYAALNANFICIDDPGTIDYYSALFNSRLMRWIYAGYFGALRMSGGYLQVQAPQLRVLPAPPPPDETRLDALGRDRRLKEEELVSARIAFVHRLIEILGVESHRIEDPSWVLPRQDAILAAVEDPAAEDLKGYWAPLQRTITALGVEMTPFTEQALTQAAQNARATLLPSGARAREREGQIDSLVYELFGLSADQVLVIEAGPPELAGAAECDPDTDDE